MIKKPSRKLRTLLWVFVVLGVIRLCLPSVIKLAINNYLEDFSPTIVAHVEDIDLGIVKSSYTLQGLRAEVKKNNQPFLTVNSINATLSWLDLFKGEISSNILIQKAHFNYSQDVFSAVRTHLSQMDPSPKNKELKVRVGRVDIKDSQISTDFFPELTTPERVVLSEVDARFTNVVPSRNLKLSPFNLKAKLLETGQLKVEGEANLFSDTPKWSVDTEILKFDMTALNKFLKEKLPLTFTKGELDFYAELKSEGGPIVGYMKPFIKGLDVIKSDEEFESSGHWLIEIISALGNITLKSDEVMATKIPFRFDKKLEIDGGETIANTITHGFTQEQSRGIENSIELKQAQEEE